MSLETLYSLSFLPAAPFWLLMIAFPHWAWTKRIVGSVWSLAPAALFYLIMGVSTVVGASAGSMDFTTLAGLAAMFGTPAGALIVWLHMLAVDLAAGRWAYLDSRERGISAWIMGPVLFLTLMAGPLGLLVYAVVRSLTRSRRQAG